MLNIHQSNPYRQANITREGNRLTVSDPTHQGCRCPGDFYYSIQVGKDSLQITGSDNERGPMDCEVRWNPKGIKVENAGPVRSEHLMTVESDSELTAAQQKELGISVASTLIGIPLLISEQNGPTSETSGPHSEAEKKAILSTFENKAGTDSSFPDPDDGYYGLHVFLLEGDKAKTAAAMGNTIDDSFPAYEENQHSLVVTANSFAEPTLGIFVLDRASQDLVGGLERNTANLNPSDITDHYPEISEDMAMFGVVGTLASAGEKLGVVSGENQPQEMDFTSWKE